MQVSKSILRAALDEFMRDNERELNKQPFYYPSYEIISDLFFSKYGTDGRHPHDPIIQMIGNLFEAAYCDSATNYDDMAKLYLKFRKKNAETAIKQVI